MSTPAKCKFTREPDASAPGAPLNAEIINEPFRADLVGKQGRVEDGGVGETGKQLMDAMWAEVGRLGLPHLGINHWVYLPDSQLFTGVQLSAPADNIGTLEPLRVELARYLRHLHRGPYADLPAVWQKLSDQLSEMGLSQSSPSLEIYGQWTEDPNQLETTILIALAGEAGGV